jgi:hypothetical protein
MTTVLFVKQIVLKSTIALLIFSTFFITVYKKPIQESIFNKVINLIIHELFYALFCDNLKLSQIAQ